jgi:threonine dehydrogenase-like Zn-dependent dehydrogenase
MQRDAELFFDWLASGAMDMSPLISHRASYQDAPKLYQMLLEDRSKAMGVILNW